MTPGVLATRTAVLLLTLIAFLMPWLAIVSDRALAWIIGPAALAAMVLALVQSSRPHIFANRGILLFLLGLGGVTGLALLSSGWGDAAYQARMSRQAGLMAPAMVAGLIFVLFAGGIGTAMASVRKAFTAGAVAAAGIALIDILSGRWLLSLRHAVGEGGFSDALTRAAAYDPAEYLARFNDFWVIATLSLAIVGMLLWRIRGTLIGLAVLLVISLLTISETSLVMALGGLVAAALVTVAGRPAVVGIGGAVVAAILTTPWLFPALEKLAAASLDGGHRITHKIRERLEIWAALSETVPDRLWFGHGIAYQRLSLDYPGPRAFFQPDKLWHPHSLFVQIWQDLGLAGATLLSVAVAGAFMAIARADASLRPGLTAVAVMVLAALGAAHSIWLGWWISGFFLIAGLTIIMTRPSPDH